MPRERDVVPPATDPLAWAKRSHDRHRNGMVSFSYGIIIIMEICKALTLRLKALNKQTHIMYMEKENVIKKKKKKKKRRKDINKGF